MADIIQILPDSVANQIAAGEVIQRPASVIKELVENAIDAGATQIEVSVIDAGRTLIQVIDNGKGMSETDARLSFERHATSKIRQAADLFDLHTMGFRGEALASIAAVAEVEVRTRREEDELGTLLSIAGSRFVSQEPCSAPVGSSFTVKNLFYNVPARRKFLKSNATEMNNIITAFERIVLVYPQIAFTLHSNHTEIQNLRRASLRQRIVDVFGKRINQQLVPVGVDTTVCRIEGFVGKPESAKKKGALQYFFVNGRYMKHPYFNRAIQTAMERMVPSGDQVPYFIYFQVAPEELDVNIHPTKTEIKFENEQAIWQILLAAVKDAVGLFSGSTSLDFDTADSPSMPEMPVFNPESHPAEAPRIKVDSSYNPFRQDQGKPDKPTVAHWENLYDGLQPAQPTQQEIFTPPTDLSSIDGEPIVGDKSLLHYQYKGQYIVTSVKSGLMIVDQHRAHERILYEQFMERLTARHGASQRLLYPEMVQLNARQVVTLNTLMPQLAEIGFELSDLGAGNYAVNAVPAGMEEAAVQPLLLQMLDAVDDNGGGMVEDTHHQLALSMARHGAVAYGQVLSNQEMESLINQLFLCQNYNYSPTGKKILNIIRQDDLEQMFK